MPAFMLLWGLRAVDGLVGSSSRPMRWLMRPMMSATLPEQAVDWRTAERPPDGLLAVYKPKGWTSSDVVAKIRNTLQKELRHRTGGRVKVKVGHGGTLDPLATGVLVIGGICSATKCLVGPLASHDTGLVVFVQLGRDAVTCRPIFPATNGIDPWAFSGQKRTPWIQKET